MKFKRINVDTVRCLISEEELHNKGLVVEDFLANDAKTEAFLREIIMQAEQEVGYKINGGNISVQVSVLPEHMLALTLSEKPDGSIMSMLENLKSAVENMPPEEIPPMKRPLPPKEFTPKGFAKGIKTDYQIQFNSFDTLMDYSNSIHLEMPVENSIYRLNREKMYFLLMKKEPMDDRQLCKLLGASLEFADGIYSHNGVRAYIQEHGSCILEENAIQTLQKL